MRNIDAKRQRILRIAEELFRDQGVERTTLKQIGDRASAAIGSITHFFGKKPELAAAVLDQMVDRIVASAERELNVEDRSVADDVRALLVACLNWPRTFPHYRHLIGALEVYVAAEGQGRRTHLQDRLSGVLAAWAARRGSQSVVPLSGGQLYAIVLAPAMCPAAPAADVDWLEVLVAAAVAGSTPSKSLKRTVTPAGPTGPAGLKPCRDQRGLL